MTSVKTTVEDEGTIYSVHERADQPLFTVNCRPEDANHVVDALESEGFDVHSVQGKVDSTDGVKFTRIKGEK
jgi:hypothetical protein